jgi:hypothetical protein
MIFALVTSVGEGAMSTLFTGASAQRQGGPALVTADG